MTLPFAALRAIATGLTAAGMLKDAITDEKLEEEIDGGSEECLNNSHSDWQGRFKCEDVYNCCDCGGEGDGCGCGYCWSCNACEVCNSED